MDNAYETAIEDIIKKLYRVSEETGIDVDELFNKLLQFIAENIDLFDKNAEGEETNEQQQ